MFGSAVAELTNSFHIKFLKLIYTGSCSSTPSPFICWRCRSCLRLHRSHSPSDEVEADKSFSPFSFPFLSGNWLKYCPSSYFFPVSSKGEVSNKSHISLFVLNPWVLTCLLQALSCLPASPSVFSSHWGFTEREKSLKIYIKKASTPTFAFYFC